MTPLENYDTNDKRHHLLRSGTATGLGSFTEANRPPCSSLPRPLCRRLGAPEGAGLAGLLGRSAPRPGVSRASVARARPGLPVGRERAFKYAVRPVRGSGPGEGEVAEWMGG
jgi:hypothetical protein